GGHRQLAPSDDRRRAGAAVGVGGRGDAQAQRREPAAARLGALAAHGGSRTREVRVAGGAGRAAVTGARALRVMRAALAQKASLLAKMVDCRVNPAIMPAVTFCRPGPARRWPRWWFAAAREAGPAPLAA